LKVTVFSVTFLFMYFLFKYFIILCIYIHIWFLFLQLSIFGNIPILNTLQCAYVLFASFFYDFKAKMLSCEKRKKKTAFVFSSVGGRG